VLLVCALCSCNKLGRRFPCFSLIRSIVFMAAFVFVWIWVIVLRFYEALAPGITPPEQLIVLHASGVSSQGFVNFLVWVTSPSLAAVLRPPACFRKCRNPSSRLLMDSSIQYPVAAAGPLLGARQPVNSLSGARLLSPVGSGSTDNRVSYELSPRTHESLLVLDDGEPPHMGYRGIAD